MRRWKDPAEAPTLLQTITIHPHRWVHETQRSVIRHWTELPSTQRLTRKERRRRLRQILTYLNNVCYFLMGVGVTCMIFGCGRAAHAVVAIVTK